MKIWATIRLVTYYICVVAVILFFWGLIHRFGVLDLYGFDLTEYWAIAVFGSVFALSVGIYSLVRAVVATVAAVKGGNIQKNPLNLTLSDDSDGEEVVPPEVKAEGEISAPTVRKEKLTRAEKRRRRLLEDDEEKSAKQSAAPAAIAFALVCACLIFCVAYSCWAAFPHRLCFHSYAYNITENGSEPEYKEIKTYRFYQSYLGKPYLLYSFDGVKEFRVPLVSEKEEGGYTVYNFHGESKYAKIVDRWRDKFTYVVCDVEVFYYSDGHIVVGHRAVKQRDGKETVYDYSGKIYSYRRLDR